MTTVTKLGPHVVTVAAELPRPEYTTDELLAAGLSHLSDNLATMLADLGVYKRHSMLTNYPDVLSAAPSRNRTSRRPPWPPTPFRRCLAQADVPMDSIGLVLGLTSGPARLLPNLVRDLFARIPEIPRTAANLSIEFMGGSAMAKAIDTARWFLNLRPEQHVLVCFTDAITPLCPASTPISRKWQTMTDNPQWMFCTDSSSPTRRWQWYWARMALSTAREN